MTAAAVESSSCWTPPPAWATRRNPLRPSYGQAVIAAAAMLGKPLMPWQAHVVEVALEVQSETAGDPEPGSWAYDTVGVSVQRQAGKTYLLRPVVAHRMRATRGARLWSTAQTRVHARRRWIDATDALLSSPLERELRRKTGVGHEELRWVSTGSTLEPFAPNGDSLHGETPVLVLVDELWAFDAEQGRELRQAYRPGFLTVDAQAWLLSTAGTSQSAWLNSLRARGRAAVEAGRDLGIAWFEWGLPDVVDGVPVDELDDEALVRACIRWHPARGHTLRESSVWAAWEEAIEVDYATGRVDFLRAYGNRTPPGGRPRTISLALWNRARTELDPAGRLALAFELDPELEESTITATARLDDGRAVSEVVEHRPGTSWVAGRVLELRAAHPDVVTVACNDAGPNRDVADVLDAAAVDETERVQRLTVRDYGAACIRLERELGKLDGPEAGPPTWMHRGHVAFDTAAAVVGKRGLPGGSTAWARHDSPITALVSGTVGLWAIDHAPDLEPGRFWIG